MTQLNRALLKDRLVVEEARFAAAHPKSLALAERAKKSLLAGVPMNWMVRWAGKFPVFVTEGKGAHFRCVDGHDYIDLCLGDTGAMTGHAPEAAVTAIAERARRGVTFMLPTEDAIVVGEELQERFGLPYWQMTLTATDANRFVLRLARGITQRPKILVFNWCYHGTVDETFITLDKGTARARAGNTGPQVDPTLTTKVVEWNDVAALEAALAPGDVAAVLTEPVMTNIGIVQPAPGFHAKLRELTKKTGTLLIMDETHTICTGPGGYSRAHGLSPDIMTLGKPIAGGVPAAVYGLSEDVAQRVIAMTELGTSDTGGIGGTLAGNALSLAAMRATLQHVLTDAAYARTISLAERFSDGVQTVVKRLGLPWHVTTLGCRAEYWFCPTPPKNGGEAAAAIDAELDRYMHLAALNRGILMTPFHNMALIAPQTSEADIDRHTAVFEECVTALMG